MGKITIEKWKKSNQHSLFFDFRKDMENGGLMVVEWVYDGWLVVTGTWLDYDFPFSWEFHNPN